MIKVDNFVKLHVLISLNAQPRHGYELMKEVEKSLDKRISASHIYPFLKELDKKKLVRAKQNDREKVYSLTVEGKQFVKKTLLRFQGMVQKSLQELLTKCTHCGCEVYNNKYTEVIKGKRLAFCCSHCADSYKEGMHGHRH